MATKSSTTALHAAMKGESVTDRQAKSALGAAVDKIASLSKRAEKSKDAMLETGTQVIHTAETQGSLFLSSMAEGYLGTEKLKMGGVDVRAPVGLVAAGYGLYETMSGKKTGGHALALGNGVLGSFLASIGIQAGRTLAEKRAGGAPAPDVAALQAPVTLTPSSVQGLLPAPNPLADLEVQGALREVLLTPESSLEGDDFDGPRCRQAGRGRGRGRRPMRCRNRRQRFLRAQREAMASRWVPTRRPGGLGAREPRRNRGGAARSGAGLAALRSAGLRGSAWELRQLDARRRWDA